jgi:hypothetical protein
MDTTDRQAAPTPSPEELIALLEQQRELYQRLQALTAQQRTAVGGEDATELLGLLGRRQEVLSALAALDERVRPIRRDWDRLRETLPAGVRARAAQVFQETRDLLAGIIESDQEVSDQLQARKTRTAQAISHLGQAERAHAAYGAAARTGSQYFDGTDQS